MKPPSTAGCSSGSACPPSSRTCTTPACMRSSIATRDRRSYFASGVPVTSSDRHRAARGRPVPHRFHHARAEHAQAARRGTAAVRPPAVGEARRVGGHASRTSVARASARGTRRRRRARPARRAPRRTRSRCARVGVVGDARRSRSRARAPRTRSGRSSASRRHEPAAHRVAGVDPRAALRRRSRARSSANVARRRARRARARRTTRATTAATPRHDAAVCVKPGTSTTRAGHGRSLSRGPGR